MSMTNKLRKRVMSGKDFTVYSEPQRKAVLMIAKSKNIFLTTRELDDEFRVVFLRNKTKGK